MGGEKDAHAAMPGEEEIARLLFERGRDVHDARTWEEANVEMREWLKGHAAAILALFMAEKQKPTVALNHWKARALAAEAALAAERERCASLVEFITDPDQDADSSDPAHCQNVAQSAFNDHSPHATMNTRLKSYGASIAAAIRKLG